MDRTQVRVLCQIYGLGDPLTELQPVPGGLLHRMWRLETTHGVFAVKELNPALLAVRGAWERYYITEGIAAAMQKQGVPAVAALLSTVQETPVDASSACLVYPWIAGEALPLQSVHAEHGRIIGSLLARMHGLQLHVPPDDVLELHAFQPEDWDILTCQASDADIEISWTYPVRISLPLLEEWTQYAMEVAPLLHQHLVVSHRHLVPQNVLWVSPSTPQIIDWESAGLINPSLEIVHMALWWSGVLVGLPHKDIFQAVLEGYYQAGGSLQLTGENLLHGCQGLWLEWLLFHMRRSLGEAVTDIEERQEDMVNAKLSLAVLRSLEEHLPEWAEWIDHLRSASC